LKLGWSRKQKKATLEWHNEISTNYNYLQTMLSRIFSFLLLILFFPVFLVVGLFILIEDGFPVFFKQKRVGINYTFFHIYKFRSMKKNTPNVATHLLENPSQYLLKLGGLIRKLSLDELPNLINILKGEMVFVGPRPALYNQDDLMQLRVRAGVDKLKPGLTGWAQVNGRDEIALEEKVAFEKEYLERQSLWFDLKIVVLTFTKVLKSQGVNH
jgi:O-antigen biosynthesis protein WbqP